MFKELLINEQIHAKEVRLVSESGEQLGVVDFASALKKADEKNLDVVLINASSNPQVCKIMDYGKYKFDTIKREKEIKKNQKVVDIKEVQLSMTIDKHDLEIKAKHAVEFLKDGDKVKISLRMKGRQQAFVANAIQVVRNFVEILAEYGQPDKEPDVLGKNIFVVVSPKKV